ncbi:MAG TPA: hypothetical protein PLA96_10770 [Candidatus Brocadia sapporoensis]|uniref:hypothetical protein n=1 Tax=Candidatus Brocadia sapporoensis TaxID=392547 RepID=UPI00191C7A5E|nr:hypothetical protein [Candidatus Brocadia sapporoensis]MCC7239776.1 hypothetical protein [Candidatus Brocadia sp.]GJQ24559.1 MAG: hypothetical protein HBSAPP01_23490 [Candidatus Brocadia sapporoensis]HQU31965.1 hypothetical protein [Candidatus Brocadia sapporoensis]
MNIANIIKSFQANRVRITDHADEEAEADKLTFDEVCFLSSMVKSLRITRTTNHIQVVRYMARLLAVALFIGFGYTMK